MEKELKPCPFCGADAHIHKCYSGSYTVSCTRWHSKHEKEICGASIDAPTRERAVKAWNRRWLK